MQGKIVKGIAGFYYVDVAESGIYECKARGIFRRQGIKPLVGDVAEISVIDDIKKTGNITDINPRQNELIRPTVANIDQALLVFAMASPSPHLNLLDRFLIMMENLKIPVIICFNKTDLAREDMTLGLRDIYEPCGYPLIFTSALREDNIKTLKPLLKGKTTAIAGPSGVGKSSIINLIQSGTHMETGEISRKIERGKHTTRHAELLKIDEDSYIMDTPGFSSLYAGSFDKEQLKYYYREFAPFEGKCRFQGCSHVHEPGCAVKEALARGIIHRSRYDTYVTIYNDLGRQSHIYS